MRCFHRSGRDGFFEEGPFKVIRKEEIQDEIYLERESWRNDQISENRWQNSKKIFNIVEMVDFHFSKRTAQVRIQQCSLWNKNRATKIIKLLFVRHKSPPIFEDSAGTCHTYS